MHLKHGGCLFNMIIREYKATDKNEVISLWHECGLIAPQNDPSKDIERKLLVDPDLFLVGICDDSVIASVMGGYEGHRAWINYLAVSPNHQRQGYGQKLMTTIEGLVKAKGSPKINLQVRNSNDCTIAFYKAIGYEIDNVISLGKRLEID